MVDKLWPNMWPNPAQWKTMTAEQRDQFMDRIDNDPRLMAQQGERLLALIRAWRHYRANHPPHPRWRENRATLARELDAFHEAHRDSRKGRSNA